MLKRSGFFISLLLLLSIVTVVWIMNKHFPVNRSVDVPVSALQLQEAAADTSWWISLMDVAPSSVIDMSGGRYILQWGNPGAEAHPAVFSIHPLSKDSSRVQMAVSLSFRNWWKERSGGPGTVKRFFERLPAYRPHPQ